VDYEVGRIDWRWVLCGHWFFGFLIKLGDVSILFEQVAALMWIELD